MHLSIIALCDTGFALILNVIGLSIPYWQKVDDVDIHIGLWQFCDIGGCDYLEDLGAIPDALKASRAMVIIGLILLIAAGLCEVLKLTVQKGNERLPKIAGVLDIIAGVHILVGCIVYATDIWEDIGLFETHLHAGFALCLTSGITSLVGGILFLLSKD